jgi:hypothetical protein
MTTYPRSESKMAVSYLTVRLAIGVLGMALPVVLGIGGFVLFGYGIQSSISYYARTDMGPVLVGTLFAAGFFLLGYRGYERADDVAGVLAWLFALGVALFTCSPDSGGTPREEFVGTLHLISSILLFATLVYFSLFLFTKTRPRKEPSPEKRKRNIVYKVCGWAMIACLVIALVYLALPRGLQGMFTPLHPVYWMEAASLEAFGVSWFVKGEGILKDG